MFESKSGIFFIAGNRDFLIGEAFHRTTGTRALPDPAALSAFGATVVATHGDALCLDEPPCHEKVLEVRRRAVTEPFPAPLAVAVTHAGVFLGHVHGIGNPGRIQDFKRPPVVRVHARERVGVPA